MNILRVKQSLTILYKHPIKILNIFNFRKLNKFIKNIFFNADIDFLNLPKKKQIKILLESFSKIKSINKNDYEDKKYSQKLHLMNFKKNI